MVSRSFKSLLVAAFSLSILLFSTVSKAQDSGAAAGVGEKKEEAKINPAKIILEHVGDGHEFHFFTFGKKPVTLALPVILYSPAKGWSAFMSSHFEHGQTEYDGYRLLDEEFAEEHKLDPAIYKNGKVYAEIGEHTSELQTRP